MDEKFNTAWALKIPKNGSIISSTQSSSKCENGQIINGKFIKTHGIHWMVGSFFIIADMAGGGIVALPSAAQHCSFYAGMFLCFLVATLAAITAILLAKCWELLTLNWSEYRKHCRKPYAEIGFRALGPIARIVVSVTLNLSQFGICVVFFLLSSQNISDFIGNFTTKGPDVCLVILGVGIVILPFTFFKSPEDFWGAIVAGMLCTGVAVLLIIIGASLDYSSVNKTGVKETPFKLMNLYSALGTFLFTYGGHSAFPTIQHDLKYPFDFKKSIILAFVLICVSYVPVMMLGHLAYGYSLGASIIPSIKTLWIQQTVNLLIALHCMLTLILMFNPLNQEVEEIFKVPQEFGPKRVTLRTLMVIAVIFVAESVPNFGPVLNLMGSTSMTLMFLIFPCIFYLFLTASIQESKQWKNEPRPVSFKKMIILSNKFILILCSFLIIFGIIGGGVATYSAYVEITDTHFKLPCFIKPFIKK